MPPVGGSGSLKNVYLLLKWQDMKAYQRSTELLKPSVIFIGEIY